MTSTARRRARHHVSASADLDPADLRCRAGSLARALVPLIAGCPDALSAERIVSDLGARWSADQVLRVVQAIELDDPEPRAVGALHALAWTLRSADAAVARDGRARCGQPDPSWAEELGACTAAGATGITDGVERLAFIRFDGPQPHVLAAGTFAGRRGRLGLLRPGSGLDAGEPIGLGAARDVLAEVLSEGTTLCHDGGPDLRRLAQRRLAVLDARDRAEHE